MSVLPMVAVVGRPNVGKSTLVNRIAGKRVAIVEDVPGVTRDRNYIEAEHEGKRFLLVDTGGFEPRPEDPLIVKVRDQAQLAIEEATVVLFAVDGVAGPTTVDRELGTWLRRSGKPVILAVNKLDSTKREEGEFLSEFYGFGFEEVFPVSAEHGRGVYDMLDAVSAHLPAREEETPAEEGGAVRLAIVGRPNVGKSTLVNSILQEERFVVSPVAGTTRDPVDVAFEHRGRRFVLTDTAGIRRKRSIAERVESYSVLRAMRAAEASDVVVLLLDAGELAVEQDARIAGLAQEQEKPIVVVINKWDQVPAEKRSEAFFREEIAFRLPFLSFAPVMFVSALTGDRVRAILDTAAKLSDQAASRVPTPPLNRLMEEVAAHHGLPVIGGKRARVYYIAQVDIRPPTFVLQTNRPDLVPPDYKRYVQNRIREVFDLSVPIRLVFKKKSSLRSKTRGPR